MRRVVAAFRLLAPRHRVMGPLQVTADPDVPADGIGLILDTVYVAASKMRQFGFADADFGGPLHIIHREADEKAHGRYLPGSDKASIFYPHARGVADWLWTVVHELAHRIWHKVLSAAERDTWNRVVEGFGTPYTPEAADSYARLARAYPDRYPLWFFFQKHFGDDQTEFRQWLTTRRYSDNMPTDYSTSNGAEAFADTVAEAVLGRSHAGYALRRTGAFPKKVLMSLLDPHRSRPYSVTEEKDDNFLQSQIELPSLEGPLGAWVAKNIDDSAILGVEHRPHVTIVYGLDRRDLHGVQKVALDFGRPIRLVVGALNYFDAPEHDVLYLEAIGSSLPELRRGLLDLPNTRPQTHPSYVPHITVAYLNKGAARKFKGQSPIQQTISRDAFTLIDSSGIEMQIPTVPHDPKAFDPLLLADTGSSGSSG